MRPKTTDKRVVPKSYKRHAYSDLVAFQRLMVLVATILNYPGVGYLDPEAIEHDTYHDALREVQKYMHKVAEQLGLDLPDFSVHTLRKDLQTLRSHNILGPRMYRWGYYLGTGVMDSVQLQVALNALASQANYQMDSRSRRIYRTLQKRLGETGQQTLTYPVRSQINRSIIFTDPEEMMTLGVNSHTLFNKLDLVELAIINGNAIELYRNREPYEGIVGYVEAWPLQLLHFDIAWYLLYETLSDNYLVIERLDRFKDYCQPLGQHRSLEQQCESLAVAQKLLSQGWGLFLGTPYEQVQEKQGQASLVKTTVRFYQPVVPFIVEGQLRHPTQKIKCENPKDCINSLHVDYSVLLPHRSLPEFSRWVCRFMENAQVLDPIELVYRFREMAQELAARYTP